MRDKAPIPFRLLAALNNLMTIEAEIYSAENSPMLDALCDVIAACAATHSRTFDEFIDLIHAAAQGAVVAVEASHLHDEPEQLQ